MRNAAIVLRTMGEVPYERWSQEQMAAISLRCNNFDVAGMFVFSKMADGDLISNGWRASIRETYDVAGPHIAAVQKRFNTDVHWSHLERLAIRAGAAKWSGPVAPASGSDRAGG
jgi:hypothetical protein